MLFRHGLSTCLFLAKASASSASLCAERIMNATEVLNQLWFNPQTGLWADRWWNSGAILTTVVNVAHVCEGYQATAARQLAGIYDAAKAFNRGSFLNNFYDDEGWWATGWIKAYDLTGDQKYLETAAGIFTNIFKGTDTKCGGIFWSKTTTYPAAISNELYLLVAASLANRLPSNRAYRDHAMRQLDWFLHSGLINSQHAINDGLDIDTCKPRGQVFTYNQGIILGALVETYRLTANSSHLDLASTLAHAAIKHLATPYEGILSEPNTLHPPYKVGSSWHNDDQQFKGIFARNLMELQKIAPDETYVDFLKYNAHSIWNNDRQADGQLGSLWQGPVVGLSAASQGSALDCLVAAAALCKAESSTGAAKTLTPSPTATPTTTTPVEVETVVVVVTVTASNG